MSIYFLACEGLTIGDVGVSRDTAFQEVRPGAGFETGDFVAETLGGATVERLGVVPFLTDSTIAPPPQKQRLSLANDSWLLDIRRVAIKISRVSLMDFLVCNGLSNIDVGVAIRCTAFQDVRPGAGFKAGDFVKKSWGFGGGYRRTTQIFTKGFEPHSHE